MGTGRRRADRQCPVRGAGLSHTQDGNERPDGRCVFCGAQLYFRRREGVGLIPAQAAKAEKQADEAPDPAPSPFRQAAGADLDAPWPDFSDARVVDEPPISFGTDVVKEYWAARRIAMLSHDEAIRLVAYMIGLQPDASEGWTLAELKRLQFLAYLREEGRIKH